MNILYFVIQQSRKKAGDFIFVPQINFFVHEEVFALVVESGNVSQGGGVSTNICMSTADIHQVDI